MASLHHIVFRFFLLYCSLTIFSCGVKKSINDRPEISAYNSQLPKLSTLNDSTFVVGNNFLTKNQQGLWELYIEGDPLERGLLMGTLTKPLMDFQEEAFFSKIKRLVPSESQQNFLNKFLAWYNRKMYRYVPEEYKAEILGVSKFMLEKYNAIAPPYLRALYLHSAHDIGHALQDLALVGCTSFAVWDEKSEDGQLLIGRNFDFYAGDDFAKNKIISFVNPDEGYRFMSVGWAGFIGVVSGMNDQGLTVTINAGKSKIPLVAKNPISLVSREILQYASTIDEAIAITKKREVFVSESIMVGSAKDNDVALIEVSPNNLGVYKVKNDTQLVCSNHFQSKAFSDDRRNLKTIENSHTKYRFERMSELLEEENKVNVREAVEILRNKNGLNDVELGYGNEKAINQLLAHHGIVFKPNELKVWVSSNPYQLGEFVAYDLNEVFINGENNSVFKSVSNQELNIAKDNFIKYEEFKNYEKYRKLEEQLEHAIDNEEQFSRTHLEQLIELNPEYWKAYYLTGKYYFKNKNYKQALNLLKTGRTKEIASLENERELEKLLNKAKRKAKR